MTSCDRAGTYQAWAVVARKVLFANLHQAPESLLQGEKGFTSYAQGGGGGGGVCLFDNYR